MLKIVLREPVLDINSVAKGKVDRAVWMETNPSLWWINIVAVER